MKIAKNFKMRVNSQYVSRRWRNLGPGHPCKLTQIHSIKKKKKEKKSYMPINFNRNFSPLKKSYHSSSCNIYIYIQKNSKQMDCCFYFYSQYIYHKTQYQRRKRKEIEERKHKSIVSSCTKLSINISLSWIPLEVKLILFGHGRIVHQPNSNTLWIMFRTIQRKIRITLENRNTLINTMNMKRKI